MPGAPSAISPNVSQPSYGLTDAGRDLHEVRVVMGASGTRWLEMTGQDLDPYVILWGLCRELDRCDLLPERRLAVRLELRDGHACHLFWLIAQRPEPEVCVKPPGYDEDLIVRTAADWLARWYIESTATTTPRCPRATPARRARLRDAVPARRGRRICRPLRLRRRPAGPGDRRCRARPGIVRARGVPHRLRMEDPPQQATHGD